MQSTKNIAAQKKRTFTHNCAQAVLCTYTDLTGLDEKTSQDIAGAYAAGMGNMEGTCGALIGAGMVLGMVHKDRNVSVRCMKSVITSFQNRNGATVCRLLKGVGTGKVLRECPDCVADACEFLEEMLPEEAKKRL